MALEKGTEEWMMFGDFFNMCKKHWEIKETDEYWRSMIDDVNAFADTYKSVPFSKKLADAFCSHQEEVYKERNDFNAS